MIHLYSHGFDGEDLIDFELKLSNPSSIAQQQKLELISTRFDIAGKAPEGVVDRHWVRKNVMNLTDYEIEKIEQGRIDDKIEDAEIEAAGIEGDAGEDFGGGDMGGGDMGGEDLFATDIPSESIPLLIDTPRTLKGELDEADEDDEDDDFMDTSIDDEKRPVKTSNEPKNVFGGKLQKTRKKTGGPLKSSMPNMASMVSVGSSTRSRDTSNKPYDNDFVTKFNESPIPSLTPEITKTLRDMGIKRNVGALSGILLESSVDHIDIEIDDDGEGE